MLRISLLVWILVAIVLAGSFVTTVLLIPQFELNAMKYIPMAAALGAIVAIVPSWFIAKAILKKA